MAHHRHLHFAPQLFDVEGILTDHQGSQIVDCSLDYARPARSFADAVDPSVGFDFDKEPVACRPTSGFRGCAVHEVGFDCGDMHTKTSPWLSDS